MPLAPPPGCPPSRPALVAGAAPALALLLTAACREARPERPEPRLVVLYATCTLNKDFLGAYDASVTYTPRLDRLAAEGVVFRRHETESGQSGISFASIFSGTQADRHGIYHHPNRLRDELYLVTEAFADAGWEPWYWSGHSMAAWDLNYAQGVPEDRTSDARGKARRLLQAEDPMFQRVLGRLDADPSYRAFVLVSFTMTHGAYHRQLERADYARFLRDFPDVAGGLTMADLEWAWEVYGPKATRLALQWDYGATVRELGLDAGDEERLARALELTYRADVAGLDRLFGGTLDLLAERGWLDESLIAFTADHGETLFQREETLFHWTHGLQLAPEVISVPWILRSHREHASRGAEHLARYEARHALDRRLSRPWPACVRHLPRRAVAIDGPRSLAASLLGRERGPAAESSRYSHTTTIGPLTPSRRSSPPTGWPRRFFGSTDVGPACGCACSRRGSRSGSGVNLDGEEWALRLPGLRSRPRIPASSRGPASTPPRHVDAEMAQSVCARTRSGLRGPLRCRGSRRALWTGRPRAPAGAGLRRWRAGTSEPTGISACCRSR